ncbi:uncharacterized protein [Argopecten irradians]|uniref:uncharacterized protein n=1 Tax=Argopecten irradians TaxID=31199 RepID=UPI0037232CE1
MTDGELSCILIDGTERKFRLAKIDVDTPFYVGELEVMCMKDPIYDLVIGNVDEAKLTADVDWRPRSEECKSAAVVTRAEAKKEKQAIRPLNIQVKEIELVGLEGLEKAQKADKSLDRWREIAKTKGDNPGNKYRMEIKNNILYRVYKQKRGELIEEIRQIAVPQTYREQVMSLAHESIVGGHLGVQKTIDRISTSFYWPGMTSDVTRYCRSCDICQKSTPKGRVTKVPLGEMPLIEEPFQRVAVDLIGPIYPASETKNRYILTVVDYATRYPEATALPKIETERIAEALLEIFCRVGFPKEILSDRGTQFTSGLMEEYYSLTGKSHKRVPDSHRSNFCMGEQFAGPMQALKGIWTDEANEKSETRNTYQYVLNLRDRLEETCKIARESLRQSQGSYKHHYDKKARDRQLEVGQKVLVLLPTDNNKLLLQWKGPFNIVEVVNQMNYKVEAGGKVKVYHVNLLKHYVERKDSKEQDETNNEAGSAGDIAAGIAVIEAEDAVDCGAVDDENLLELGNFSGKENFKDVQISEDLTEEQQSQAIALLEEFQDIFTDIPGTTHLQEHRIETTCDDPIRVKPYPIPYAKRKEVQEEVRKMVKMGIVEPSTSAYNAPIVIVKKKDQTNRVCIDFRKLNAITRFDPEPMGDIEDIMTRLNKDNYFSKFDLSKGYWQIPVEDNSRHMTAFSTSEGCYQFRKLPFGLVNSGATFNRMMRKMLDGSKNTDHYVDDILGHNHTWKEHIEDLRNLFIRILDANLTVRPSKCMIGYRTLGFVGHTVGEGTIAMEDDQLEKIRDAQQPKTKKQVRAFLGLAGYYRKFVPNFANVAKPLSDLTKKGRPNQVDWGPQEEEAFRCLKDLLTQAPILRLPDLSKTFIVQSDASDTGLGCVLLQEHTDGIFPVAYASKKLLDRERNYSVIERECLAIVFAMKKFQMYLYGCEFILYTDHRPLVFIQKSKIESSRVMRWALFLQNYKFRIKAIKGSENVAADYLSRQY